MRGREREKEREGRVTEIPLCWPQSLLSRKTKQRRTKEEKALGYQEVIMTVYMHHMTLC